MRLARILGAVGRALISAGVIVLLFVAYQLWGTGLQQTAAQNDLGNEFEEQTGIEIIEDDTQSLAEAAAASQEAIEAGQIIASDPETVLTAAEDESAPTESGEAAPTPDVAELIETNFDEEQRASMVAKLYPEPGEAFARVVIPAINVDQISVEGVSVEDLRKGPGHYRTTPNPGQAGNAAIAGHRTTYGAPFNRVDELKPGDPIFVTTAQGTFQYNVMGFDNPAGGPELGYFIVSPSDTWVLNQQEGQNILTLTACHPKFSARQRIIVQAELVGEPAPTIPRDEALELGEVTIDSGSRDERAAEADAVDGDTIPEEEQVIIGDDVAADDDPSVDSEGNPIEDPEADTTADDAAAEDAGSEDGDTAAAGAAASSGDDTDSNGAEASTASATADEVDVTTDNSDLAAAQTPLSADPDDFGEGLNGDPEKVRPAIMWGVAGFFIWIAAWFMGKELERKWTLYAIGFLPFIVTLWSTFVNLDQALPSY